jgi:hypothetical protein
MKEKRKKDETKRRKASKQERRKSINQSSKQAVKKERKKEGKKERKTEGRKGKRRKKERGNIQCVHLTCVDSCEISEIFKISDKIEISNAPISARTFEMRARHELLSQITSFVKRNSLRPLNIIPDGAKRGRRKQ